MGELQESPDLRFKKMVTEPSNNQKHAQVADFAL